MSEQDEVEAVNNCMSFIPDEMDKSDGRNLMMLLYKTGFLSDYLDGLDTAGKYGFEYYEVVDFSQIFDFQNCVTINPETGRITYLNLDRMNYIYYNEEQELQTYELPSIIEKLDMLESIRLYNCHLIPTELAKLSQLKYIGFHQCGKNLLENIPEGLQLPLSTKTVDIDVSESHSYSSLVPFMKILPEKLEAISFCFREAEATTREQADELLRIFEKDGLFFSQSLTTLGIRGCKLNEDDFELLLFEIRSNFPNLHTIDVSTNGIKSLLGIEARIKRMVSSSSSSSSSSSRTELSNTNNLCKIGLASNPVHINVIVKNAASINPKEKAAMLTFLNEFDGISNLGLYTFDGTYNPDIEYVLRRNKVNMKYTTTAEKGEGGTTSGGNGNTTIINRSLWPLIFERAYTNSHEIYDFSSGTKQKVKSHKKCATGLFELVRHGLFFAEDHPRQYHDDSNRTKTTTTTTTTTTTSNCDNGTNNM